MVRMTRHGYEMITCRNRARVRLVRNKEKEGHIMPQSDTTIKAKRLETIHHEPKVTVPEPSKLRAAAYCRVSTLSEEQELSYETQYAYYQEYITRKQNMTLVGVYGDDGLSGLRSERRTGFLRMMEDCRAGKIDIILVKSISRFSRNIAECLKYLRELKDRGIDVVFEKEGLNSLNPQTEMVLSVFASIAQNESAALSGNVRWAIDHRAKQGNPVRPCNYGYRSRRQLRLAGREPGPETTWEIEPEEAERIRLMFELASEAYSIGAIKESLDRLEAEKGTGY